MVEWIRENAASILVGGILALGLLAIVVKLHHDKKKGKSDCGCNCENCPSGGLCHPK